MLLNKIAERKVAMLDYIESLARTPESKKLVAVVYHVLDRNRLNFRYEKELFQRAILKLHHLFKTEDLKLLNDILAAEEARMNTNLAFLVWLGLFQNLNCYLHPKEKKFIIMDFHEFHNEEYMNSLHESERLSQLSKDFFENLSDEQEDTYDFINSYYAYLETFGYKIAHYVGFYLGNILIPSIYKDYVPNWSLTEKYQNELQQYFLS